MIMGCQLLKSYCEFVVGGKKSASSQNLAVILVATLVVIMTLIGRSLLADLGEHKTQCLKK